MSFPVRTLGTNTHRLAANSTRELAEALDRLAARYGYDHPFQGRKLKGGPLLNVLLLHFLLLPEADQIVLLGATIPELEALLGGPEDVEGFLRRVESPRPAWSAPHEAGVPLGRRKRTG